MLLFAFFRMSVVLVSVWLEDRTRHDEFDLGLHRTTKEADTNISFCFTVYLLIFFFFLNETDSRRPRIATPTLIYQVTLGWNADSEGPSVKLGTLAI